MSWSTIKLGDAATFINGYAFKPSEWKKSGLPIIRIQDLTGNGYEQNFFDGQLKDKYLVKQGDLLISWSASLGVFEWKKKDAWLNQHIFKVAFDKLEWDKTFFKYLVDYKINEIEREVHGSTMKHITKGKFDNIKIPHPPLPIQRKIAAILHEADALRQKDQQLLTKYDKLLDSLFYNFFGDPVKNEKGWNIVKLGSVCDVGSSKRVFVDELVEDGIPFFRGTEIGSMSVGETITPSLFITQEHYDRLKADTGVPKIGDLLLPSICPDGRIYEVSDDNPFYFKDGRVLWIKMNSEIINGAFLKTCLKQIFATDYLKIASGTTFAELKIFELKKMETILPPISLQNKFASVIKNIEEQKRLANQQIQKSEKLFQALLQKTFKGELVK